LWLSGPKRVHNLQKLMRAKSGNGYTRKNGVGLTPNGARQSFYLFPPNGEEQPRRRRSAKGAHHSYIHSYTPTQILACTHTLTHILLHPLTHTHTPIMHSHPDGHSSTHRCSHSHTHTRIHTLLTHADVCTHSCTLTQIRTLTYTCIYPSSKHSFIHPHTDVTHTHDDIYMHSHTDGHSLTLRRMHVFTPTHR
jgi:hypothetical protein